MKKNIFITYRNKKNAHIYGATFSKSQVQHIFVIKIKSIGEIFIFLQNKIGLKSIQFYKELISKILEIK